MTTQFAGIVAALVVKLQAAPAVSTQVDRARLRPVKDDQASAVVVRIAASNPERFAILGGPTDWDTEIAIECYARSATLAADEAVDALLAAVWAKLAQDTTLGGLVMDLNPTGLEYDFALGADNMACATLALRVLHRTTYSTLE